METIQKFIQLLCNLLNSADNNLDKYIQDERIVIPKEERNIDSLLNDLIHQIFSTYIVTNDVDLLVETVKERCKEGNNKLFSQWLIDCIKGIAQPFIETDFIRKMDEPLFMQSTLFCLQHCIMQDEGEENPEGSPFENKAQLIIFKKAFLTFIDMIIGRNYSKQNAINSIQGMLSVEVDQLNIWWEAVNQNKESLWRIVIMKKFSRIEQRLEVIEGLIEK